jgi:hypothetical protein
MPPATEASVQNKASVKARSRRASTIGTSSVSGGSGKKELSAKDTAISAKSAFGPSASFITQLYKRLSIGAFRSAASLGDSRSFADCPLPPSATPQQRFCRGKTLEGV